MVLLFEQPAGGPAVGADPGVGMPGLNKDLRFITGHAGRNILARFDQYAGLNGSAQVSPRQNRRTAPALPHALGQVIHHGRLSRSSHADAADAHYCCVQMPRSRYTSALTP